MYKKIYNRSRNSLILSSYQSLNSTLNTATKKNKNIKIVKNIYKCSICSITYNQKCSLKKHISIHTEPVKCPFINCTKLFSPIHKYQYKQHIDSHNGGLNIKCKFCEHISKTLTSNTMHMKTFHSQQYTYYMNEINKYNTDNKSLNLKQIINLTSKLINKYDDTNYTNQSTDTDTDIYETYEPQEPYIINNEEDYKNIEDYEFITIENNKYNNKYYKNNLDLLASIAILQSC